MKRASRFPGYPGWSLFFRKIRISGMNFHTQARDILPSPADKKTGPKAGEIVVKATRDQSFSQGLSSR